MLVCQLVTVGAYNSPGAVYIDVPRRVHGGFSGNVRVGESSDHFTSSCCSLKGRRSVMAVDAEGGERRCKGEGIKPQIANQNVSQSA